MGAKQGNLECQERFCIKYTFMHYFRSHINRWVVVTLFVTSILSFVEHTCHMDVVRLFSASCCCDQEAVDTYSHHKDSHDTSEDVHNGHGMMDHGMMGHMEPEPMTRCSHDVSDSSTRVAPPEACCLSVSQAERSPTWVRVLDSGMQTILVAKHVGLFSSLRPTLLSDLSLPPPQPRISWPPGYISFGAFLN